MTPPPLELRAGRLRLALCPALGGSIAGLWWGDVPVLRSTEAAELKAARLSGCYPLVPYSNRVGYRRFSWQGQDHTTAANFDDNPHSVHGVAWLRPWTVTASSAAVAELAYTHEADAHWPFAFEARQKFVLTPEALQVHLSVTNLAATTQPVGLGWHPYFPKRDHSHLNIQVSGRWDNDASGLPTHRVSQAGIDDSVASLAFDNCFDGWQGPALVRDEKLALTLTASVPYLVVFTPDNKPYYCVEPVSHVSNAVQMADPPAHGLLALAPQAACEVWMKLAVTTA